MDTDWTSLSGTVSLGRSGPTMGHGRVHSVLARSGQLAGHHPGNDSPGRPVLDEGETANRPYMHIIIFVMQSILDGGARDHRTEARMNNGVI